MEPTSIPMTEHNLPDKDDAPWLDCMDGFQVTKQQVNVMNNFTDFAYRLFWFGVCIIVIIMMLYVILNPPPKTVAPRFEVVDTYKNCEVVRWTDPSQRWQYFLDCSKSNH